MAVQNLYGAGMGANPGDSLQISLVKIVAQLEELLSLNSMAVPNIYGAGMGPNTGDSLQINLVKIVAHLKEFVDNGGGSGGGGGSPVSGGLVLYDELADLPAAPSDPTKVWLASFRDGSAGRIWDPTAAAWI